MQIKSVQLSMCILFFFERKRTMTAVFCPGGVIIWFNGREYPPPSGISRESAKLAWPGGPSFCGFYFNLTFPEKITAFPFSGEKLSCFVRVVEFL